MESNDNKKIQKTLNDLYLYHSKIVKSFTLNKFINNYIIENDNYYKSIGIKNYKSDQEVKELLDFAENKAINEAFMNVKEINVDEKIVSKNFEDQINKSLAFYETSLTNDLSNINYQSIFIEDDYFPEGFISLYGKGNFKILDKPEYLDFDYNNQLFNENCKIDYSTVMKKLIDFNQIIEESGFDNFILDSQFYDSLSKMYRFKIFLLLNLAFQNVNFSLFTQIKIQRPLYVFANEHDCEVSNIYVF